MATDTLEAPPKEEKGIKIDDTPDIGEAEVDAYMDLENGGSEKLTDKEYVQYLRVRHEEIKGSYKTLTMNLREAEAGDRREYIMQLRENFRLNYKSRKVVVRELRKLGEKVEDKFIAS